MTNDAESHAALHVLAALRAADPFEAARIDEALAREGHVDAAHTWIERFSRCTTDAIQRGDLSTAAGHLQLVSRLVGQGDAATVRCIDVAYVESLMWNIESDTVKRKGWQLFPANLRKLYVAMWGEKPFMTAAR